MLAARRLPSPGRGVALEVRPGWPAGRDFVRIDEVGGNENKNLAHQVRVLLVTAHKADHATAGRVIVLGRCEPARGSSTVAASLAGLPGEPTAREHV